MDALVALAVAAAESDYGGGAEQESDYDAFMNAVNDLPADQRTPAFDTAVGLLAHPRPANRCAAADMVDRLATTDAGLAVDDLVLRGRSSVLDRVTVEQDEDVLHALVIALGHLHTMNEVDVDPRALPALLGLVEHPSAQVRYAVARYLPVVVGEDVAPVAAVDALLKLSRDIQEEVRDWATFGLGSAWDLDSEAVRAALTERLDDDHPDTREEAIIGLARRRDEQAVELLAEVLMRDDVSFRVVSAVEDVADPRLLPALAWLSEWWPQDGADILERAIRACTDGAIPS